MPRQKPTPAIRFWIAVYALAALAGCIAGLIVFIVGG